MLVLALAQILKVTLNDSLLNRKEIFLKFLGRQSYLLVIMLRLQQDENYFEFLKGYKWTEDIGHILVDL